MDFALDEDNVDEWLDELDGDVVKVETVVNYIHLWDLFHESSDDVPSEALDELGKVLAKCWGCAARDAFPERDFVVAV